ncbi:mitochondrial sodium/calcium exchanger protein isoform X2 [Latimeria chalumnae]|uniref:mitochondrial sodium/calcium exchanger protein isoform X2 n=1 Tax=Latimeria chalumnae TaxID=7897 RepID=UPI00313F3448
MPFQRRGLICALIILWGSDTLLRTDAKLRFVTNWNEVFLEDADFPSNRSNVSWHLAPQSSGTEECRDVKNHNASEWCQFVQTNADCQFGDCFLNYLRGAYCTFPHALLPLAVVLYALWLFYLFIFLGVAAEKFFCPNLATISTNLKLNHNVAGVTFLAFGNGAPDVFSAVAAFSDPRTAGLAIGALFGAGVFVTTVVAGGVSLVKPFTIPSRPFLRDVIFYMGTVFWTFLILFFKKITLGEALGYLGLYVLYVCIVIFSTWIYKKQKTQSQGPLQNSHSGPVGFASESEEVHRSNSSINEYVSEYQPLIQYQESTATLFYKAINPVDFKKWRRKKCLWRSLKALKLPIEFLLLLTVPVVDPDKEDHNWKRPLNCLHLITSPLVCILTFKSGKYGLQEIGGLFPVWAVVLLVGVVLAAIVFFTTQNEQPPVYHCLFSFLGFVVSAMWISAVATEVVNLLRTIGIIFDLSNTVLGLTFLAWGNSIGDCFSNIAIARQGYPRMAIAACFGGIIFNMLVGVGFGCLLEMHSHHYTVKQDPKFCPACISSLGPEAIGNSTGHSFHHQSPPPRAVA